MDKIERTIREFVPHSAEYCVKDLATAIKKVFEEMVGEELLILKALILLCDKRKSAFKYTCGKGSKFDYCDGIITRERSIKSSAGTHYSLACYTSKISRLWSSIKSDDLIEADAKQCYNAAKAEMRQKVGE